ncbi:MAG: S-layer homology domain-containing protein, partial [Eubacteriales bacterium]|nr:S-layer homology domain-containing protein [Eubacteriales bacterium]
EDAPQPPAAPVFPDVAGHWAENALRTAVDMGLLKGVDGKMLPDHPVKRSEAIVMLDRALGATTAAPTTGLSRVPQHAWYANDLGKAIHLGLIAADDDRYFDAPASRAEAFELLARAFVFDRAQTASDALQPFTDADAMTAAQRQAAAVLVESGIIQGSTATTLAPQAQLTRAQFVTMITRVASHLVQPQEDAPAALAGGSILALPDSRVEDVLVPGDLVFAAPTAEAVLDAVTAQGRIVLKGGEQTALTLSNGTLLTTLAVDPAGTATVYLSRDSKTDTLVIAGTGGAVSYRGAVNAVEITASGRTIDLSGVSADALTITGSGNTIVVDGTVGTVTVAPGAKHNALTLNGAVQNLTVAGVGTRVDGRGRAEAIDIRVVDRTIDLPAGVTTEQLDPGLAGVALEMGVPTKVTPGGSLLTQVKFTGVTAPKTCTAQWYQDGQPLAGCGNDHFLLTADALSRHTTTFHFTKDMPSSVTMGFRLTYHNPSTDELEQRYIEKTVPIENYSDAWYYERDAKRVLGLVSSTYRGNYTTSYAVKNDYSATEKEVWVNAKGYASKTPYLAWINRAYQHVNIFKGSKGDWKLVKSFVVGTGAASTPTPVGVTHVTYKSAAGWTTGTYTVRPVVGFYPNSGYAFHSRLCYPGTDREYDFSSGYPVSHGCVRMQKSDIRWIYDNVPIGTTVVIF